MQCWALLGSARCFLPTPSNTVNSRNAGGDKAITRLATNEEQKISSEVGTLTKDDLSRFRRGSKRRRIGRGGLMGSLKKLVVNVSYWNER